MGQYFGMSCLGRTWHGVACVVGNGSLSHGQLVSIERSNQTVSALPAGVGGLFEYLDQRLWFRPSGGSRDPKPFPNEPLTRDKLRGVLDSLDLLQAFSNATLFGNPAAVGVAHPYGVSPALRRSLPVIVGGESVELSSRPSRAAENVNLKALNGQPIYASGVSMA